MLSSVANKFINDRGSVAGEIVGENVYSYVRGNGLVSYNDGTDIGLYTTNLHGDVSQIIAYGQKSLAKYGFDAFGNENTAENSVHNPFGYCGEYRDDETGLIYLRARYYDTDAGRFISEDPAKDGMNWYVYCGNNPVMYVDPWGMTFLIAWSYGTPDATEYEQYCCDSGVDVTVDGDTSDWDETIWNDFTQKSSFARAAYTKKQELIAMGISESDIDVQRIDNRVDLKDTWDMWSNYELVEGLYFYSHGYDGGPEVYSGSGSVLRDDNLQKLNWGNQKRQLMLNGKQYSTFLTPTARFFGCNTANGEFAQNFANQQGVITMCQTNYSSFSYTRNTYLEIKTHDTSLGVYMGVYKRNIFGFKTTLINMKVFVPQ